MSILDGRTREARRQEIRWYIREHGGYSIFWVTQRRFAKVATEMVDSGEVVVTSRQYPWVNATLKEQE